MSFYTPAPGSDYQVCVAGAVRDIAAAPVAGRGTIAVGGYHTVRLATPVAVTAGQEFVVAVRLTTPGYGRPIPVEHPSDLIAPRAAPRQSYISHGGATWTDLATKPGFETSNVCLKAFVDSGGAGDTAAPKAVVGAAQARAHAGRGLRRTWCLAVRVHDGRGHVLRVCPRLRRRRQPAISAHPSRAQSALAAILRRPSPSPRGAIVTALQ